MNRRLLLALPVLGLVLAASASAQAPAAARRYVCPIDGATTQPVGTDGKLAPKTYSDLEEPTTAYTNLVAGCPKCGYATWTQDFELPVDGSLTAWVRQRLAATAKRAGTDPVYTYQHHLQLLEQRRAGLRERIGATLFYSYVLKRHRPQGGQNPALERQIRDARRQVLALLEQAIRTEPPKTRRGRLEWQYLVAELTRLTGEPRKAAQLLKEVCAAGDEAGYMLERLSCEMAERARLGQSVEDYRDGVFDISVVPAVDPPRPAPPPAEAAQPPPAPRETEPARPLPPMERQPPPRESGGDAVPPPAPPTAT